MNQTGAQSKKIKQDKQVSERLLVFKEPVHRKKRTAAFTKSINALQEKHRAFYEIKLLDG
ncbi:MAG: hypothetical protein LUH10_12230 [Tannerellaceae bacterium]|nr:hypothetical protein [Tannerellaceae bacterium]